MSAYPSSSVKARAGAPRVSRIQTDLSNYREALCSTVLTMQGRPGITCGTSNVLNTVFTGSCCPQLHICKLSSCSVIQLCPTLVNKLDRGAFSRVDMVSGCSLLASSACWTAFITCRGAARRVLWLKFNTDRFVKASTSVVRAAFL